MKFALSIIVVLSSLAVTGNVHAKLGVGDKAPKLSIKHWIKGKSVDPTSASPDKVFVVEFWATWCGPCVHGIPHLSEMQDHFKDKGVTFIGVSNESRSKVKKFLDKGYDAKMRYTVAIDDSNQTNKAWMAAAGQNGIPCAFVVKGGRIKWIGHPMNGLDTVVAEQCGDTKYAERKKKRQLLEKKIQDAARDEKWEQVLEAVEQILELDPHSFSHKAAKYHLLVARLNKAAEGAKWGRKIVGVCDSVESLDAFAWNLLMNEDFDEPRDVELAKTAIKKALKLSDEKSPSVMDTYARVLSVSGDLKGAIHWQSKAIELCDDRRAKRDYKNRLAEYKKQAKAEEV
ncbi:MAG: redoxin domain-containing protein [Phycisphaerales bacterium]|nr:redoxin domain-containing protein [Phycisphaerales bacterium]